MKKVALLLLIVVSACKYNDMPTNTCDVRDPANDLPWLKELISDLDKSSIREYFRVELVSYKGEAGFYVQNCCPMCSTLPIFYRCNGEAVKGIDVSKLVFKGGIWQPANYSCMH